MNDAKGQFRILDILMGLLITLCMAIGGYIINELGALHTKVHSIDVAVSEMKGNRFTNGDGLSIWKEIAELKTRIATIPTEAPPKWFLERVDRMEENQQRLLAELDGIRSRLSKLEK